MPGSAEAAKALDAARAYLKSISNRYPEPAELKDYKQVKRIDMFIPPLSETAMKRNSLKDLNDMRRETATHIISLLKACQP